MSPRASSGPSAHSKQVGCPWNGKAHTPQSHLDVPSRDAGSRTRTMGVKVPCATVTLHPQMRLARREGIEPSSMVLETIVLPLNYQRIYIQRLQSRLGHGRQLSDWAVGSYSVVTGTPILCRLRMMSACLRIAQWLSHHVMLPFRVLCERLRCLVLLANFFFLLF